MNNTKTSKELLQTYCKSQNYQCQIMLLINEDGSPMVSKYNPDAPYIAFCYVDRPPLTYGYGHGATPDKAEEAAAANYIESAELLF